MLRHSFRKNRSELFQPIYAKVDKAIKMLVRKTDLFIFSILPKVTSLF